MSTFRTLLRGLLGRRLPHLNGTLTLPHLHDRVRIDRDAYGIPYIQASCDHDAWFALGFCQGQDRTFQIELLQRVVRGTLAELIGEKGLPVDRLSRRIGFYRTAISQWRVQPPAVKQLLEAFCLGVQEGQTRGLSRKPHEFVLLRTSPSTLTPVDVLGILKLMSFTLMANWDSELMRLRILQQDGLTALKDLDPTYPEWHPVTCPPGTPAGQALDYIMEELELFTRMLGAGGGSNNWSIAPSRTASGHTLVANDPHLVPALPAHWYLAHLRTPEWELAGAVLTGTPGFAIGCNGYAAWGVTAGLIDNTDLFIEEIGPDGTSVREGDTFVPCQVYRETYRTRKGKTYTEDILLTPRGPIVSPVLKDTRVALSMRATWLEDRPVEGLLLVHRARSFETFRQAFKHWPVLSLNVIYGDKDGHIGWQLAGLAPQRRTGKGALPLPGFLPEADWEPEGVPFEQMPHCIDPEEGFLATANNQPIPSDQHPFLGVDWIDGYRQARILEQLQKDDAWTIEKVALLQMDQYALPWRELRPILLDIPSDRAGVKLALDFLREWDGHVREDSTAATIFECFLSEMYRRIIQARAPRSYEEAVGKGYTVLTPYSIVSVRRTGHLVRLLREQPHGWFKRPWAEEMSDALLSVILNLRETYGQDPSAWAWGHVRTLTLPHPLGEQKPLDRVFNRGPFPWGGDANTVSQASAPPDNPTANPIFIASLRMAIEMSDPPVLRFVLPGGQSGNPFSPHYDDQLPHWLAGTYIPLHWTPEDIEAHRRYTLVLTPEQAAHAQTRAMRKQPDE